MITDRCERWMLRSPEEIIERLLAIRPVFRLPETKPDRCAKDRYYTLARRLRVRQAMKAIKYW